MNSYNKSSNLRNTFHNNFLSTIYHNLDCPSSREVYNYEYFFKINGPNDFENTNENSHLVKTKSSSDFNTQKVIKTKDENQIENIEKNECNISFENENDDIIDVKDNESEENIEVNEKEFNISIINENDEVEEADENKVINEKVENENVNEKEENILENKKIGYGEQIEEKDENEFKIEEEEKAEDNEFKEEKKEEKIEDKELKEIISL